LVNLPTAIFRFRIFDALFGLAAVVTSWARAELLEIAAAPTKDNATQNPKQNFTFNLPLGRADKIS
jgi:hypothetical protein